MEIEKIETNRGKPSIIIEGFLFRKGRTLKNGDIHWRCCTPSCGATIRTDTDAKVIIRANQNHNHMVSERHLESKKVRVSLKRKACQLVSEKPDKMLRSELLQTEENCLLNSDLTNIKQAIYFERRKAYPALPKSRDEAVSKVVGMDFTTNKHENFVLHSDEATGMIIFSCNTNLDFMCNAATELYADGTFKCAPKFYAQLFTIHGFCNGHYVPLIFACLPDKAESTYSSMISKILEKVRQGGFSLNPQRIVLDFELASTNAFRAMFPTSKVVHCRFHLGQNFYRKIQKLGLCKSYQESDSEIGKWLTMFFGLSFLASCNVGDLFAQDIMSAMPDNDACTHFADYVVDNYIDSNAIFQPESWAEVPGDARRTNNGCESFHAHYNKSFYESHPNIFKVIEVLTALQCKSYITMRSSNIPRVQTRIEQQENAFLVQQCDKLW